MALKAFRTKPGKVRFKNGGFLQAMPDTNKQRADDLLQAMQGFADHVKEAQGTSLAGFAFVAWSSNGGHSAVINTRAGCPITETTAPDAARAALQRHVWRSDIFD